MVERIFCPFILLFRLTVGEMRRYNKKISREQIERVKVVMRITVFNVTYVAPFTTADVYVYMHTNHKRTCTPTTTSSHGVFKQIYL